MDQLGMVKVLLLWLDFFLMIGPMIFTPTPLK
jgi:hypothetical protein